MSYQNQFFIMWFINLNDIKQRFIYYKITNNITVPSTPFYLNNWFVALDQFLQRNTYDTYTQLFTLFDLINEFNSFTYNSQK